MLQMFYLDVVYVCNSLKVFLGVFASVFDVCCKCFSYFKCMLQVFHLDVANRDRGVPRVAGGTCHSRLLQLLGHCQVGIDIWVEEVEGA
jgi:hypothetical protein